MRKFFKSLLAVALVGAMVGNVACNKYDDDINSLNERLDKIEGTMALKTDLQAVQSTVNALNAINFDAFMKSADFASMLEKAGVSKNQILALIEGLQDADDVAATFDAMMKAYDIWGKIEAAMVEAFGGAEGDDVKATIDAWLGAEFAEYMKSYDAKVAKDIKDANDALYESIMEAISKGETTSAGLAVRIDAIEKAIEAFEALVFEVAGRIQSLVWVPNSLIQASTNMVKLTNTNIVLTKGNTRTVVPMWNPEVTMTWQVSPAAVASKIKAENLSIVTEEVSRAAAYTAPEFEVLKAEAKDGKITVTFKATTDLNKMNPEKAPMVALNVKMGSEEAGIDFTSNYVAVLVENETVSTSTFKYVNGDQAVAFGGETKNEIEYTNTDKHFFLEGGFIGMLVNGKYVDVTTKFESLGENGWLDIVCTPEVDADKNLVASKLYAGGAVVTDEALLSKISLSHEGFGLGEVNHNFIGKTVKSGKYTYTIEGEAGSYTLGTITDVYDITTITKTIAVEAQKFNWTYANAMEYNNYSKKGLSLTGLTAAQYQALGSGLNGGLYKNATDTTSLNKAYIAFTTEPTANTDVMWFDLYINGAEAFEKAGNYVAKFTQTIDDCDVVITIPVVVEKGIVKLATANLGDKVYTFDGQYIYDLVADLKKAVLEANAGVFNEQFTKANFEHMWANATFDEVGDFSIFRNAEVELTIDMATAKFGTAYNVGYELTANVTESLVTGVSAKVMLVKPQATFEANPYYVVDGRMEMITAFSQAGDEFDVIDKMITKAYAIKGVKDAKLSYEIATDLSKFTGVKPEITTDANGDYILSWGDWNKLELELVAKATLNGVEVGSQKFVAYITDPVAKAMTIRTVKQGTKDVPVDLTLYAGESKNVYDVLSLIANEKNVFDFTNHCLEANLEAALNASVIFETEALNPALSFDKTTGAFAVDAAGMNIQGDHPVTIKVVYTYTFGVREFAFDFVVKSGARPQGI